MARRIGMPRRSDITKDIDESGDLMEQEREFMETAVADHDVVEGTLGAIDLDITEEGAHSVESALHGAGDAAGDEFNEHDGELERIQDANTNIETDLRTRENSGEGDLRRTETARTRVEVRDVVTHMEQALESLQEDLEFLRVEGNRAREAREDIEREQAALRARLGKRAES